jgi:hypothetical protein
LDKQIVRLLLDSAVECGKARSFVAELQRKSSSPDFRQSGSEDPAWLRNGGARKRASAIARYDPAAAAAVIMKWVNNGK